MRLPVLTNRQRVLLRNTDSNADYTGTAQKLSSNEFSAGYCSYPN
jgi:hypothetical protein